MNTYEYGLTKGQLDLLITVYEANQYEGVYPVYNNAPDFNDKLVMLGIMATLGLVTLQYGNGCQVAVITPKGRGICELEAHKAARRAAGREAKS